jgi:hypothetical protein
MMLNLKEEVRNMTTTHGMRGSWRRLFIHPKVFIMKVGKGTNQKRILIAILVAVVPCSNYCKAEDGKSQIEDFTSLFKEFNWIIPLAGSDERFPSSNYKLQHSKATIPFAPAQDKTSVSGKPEGNGGFFQRLFDAYVEEFNGGPAENGPEPPRRALPSPWDSPPFPGSEYQGYPLIGVAYSTTEYPLMKAIYGGPYGDAIRASRVKAYGWLNPSGNWSTSSNSNMPSSYWFVPNQPLLNQAVFRIEREVDSVQTDHIDVGFRSTSLYGTDYRYMTAGGWFSDQLLERNQLYGFDPTELYLDVYIPKVMQGLILRFGRWVACPDIETQFAPDNYLATHSLLFTFDTYTQTGVMATFMINKQWIIQAGIHAGTDMAPWYKGATPTGMLGVRWVSRDNNDSVYLVLNSINDAKFRHFDVDGQPAGHDNFNYLVGTWQHRFSRKIHTKFESYIMWQRDAVVGGTPSIGPVRWFGGGGGIGKPIPGISWTYGLLNYTMFQVSPKDYFTVRNEWWRDEEGERSGFASTYTSHTIGLSHQFNPVLIIRPEIGYYRSYNVPTFDNGTRKDMVLGGLDMILRF